MNQELFSLPAMEIKKTIKSPLTTEFIFEHLENGLATTLGNTFRRLLLTQVPGWAIFAVKISDKENTIATEFEKLKGVVEIPLYLVFNLKKLAFQSPQEKLSSQGQDSDSPICTLQINIDNSQKNENYVVTGKDIKGNLKVVNPEVYLATVEAGSQLKIDLHCRYHWSSSVAREQKYLLPEKKNIIFLPSDYCPIKTVSWQVKPVIDNLVKQRERLKLTITTNGSISPQDSLLIIIDFIEQSLISIRKLISSEPLKAKIKKEKVVEEE